MVVAQHMPRAYTQGFAEYLTRRTGLEVYEGEQGMILQPAWVIIAPGGRNCTVTRKNDRRFVFHARDKPDTPIKPSVDLLFIAAAAAADNPAAVIMSGMGNDGARGAKEFQKKGLPVLVQEPSTCVVDGMPRAAIRENAVTEALEVRSMGRRLALWAR